MRRSGKSCFYRSYSHPQSAMGPRHSQEPSWVSGVNKISEERGRCAGAYAQNGNTVARGGVTASNQRVPRPYPRPVTTGDNNNTIITITTFSECGVKDGRTSTSSCGSAALVRGVSVCVWTVRFCCGGSKHKGPERRPDDWSSQVTTTTHRIELHMTTCWYGV